MKKIYLIATIVAVITAVAVYSYIDEITNKSLKSNEQLIGVVIAATDISEKTTITEDMIKLSYLPKNSVFENVISDKNEIIGKTTTCKMIKNEMFLTGKVMTLGDIHNEDLDSKIEKGYRAMTFSVDEITGIAGYIKEGNTVDILASHSKDNVTTTYVCLENVKVVSVGSKTVSNNETGYTNITCMIPANDCTLLFSEAQNGFLSFVLRGIDDESYVDVPAVLF